MITINSHGVVQISLDDRTYSLNDPTSYTDFLIAITNPNPKVVLPKESFDVDPSLSSDSEEEAIASRYSQFLQSFIGSRAARLEQRAIAIEEGAASLLEAEKLVAEQLKTSQPETVEPEERENIPYSGDNQDEGGLLAETTEELGSAE